MKEREEERKPCTNEGCRRPAQPGRNLCDTCDIEWGLYRRDLRRAASAPRP